MYSLRSSIASVTGPAGAFVNYNFRMIDAGSEASLMDIDLRYVLCELFRIIDTGSEATHISRCTLFNFFVWLRRR